MKTKNLIAACAILAATLGAAVAPAEAQPMMMHHHHGMMMRHHMMHPRMMMMRHHMMHRKRCAEPTLRASVFWSRAS